MSNLRLESDLALNTGASFIGRLRIGLALVAVLGLSSTLFQADEALAYSAGSSAGQTLVGYKPVLQFVYFQYTAQSSVQYTKIWNGSWYTRVDSAFHQSKTNSDWTAGWSGLLSTPGVWTTLYSGGVYMATLHSLNGTCTGPPWTAWWCDSGTLSMTFLGNGTANWTGYMAIGGDGWGTYSGGNVSGSYAWSAP